MRAAIEDAVPHGRTPRGRDKGAQASLRGHHKQARENQELEQLADYEAATAGVECRKDADVIDETPGAYKPIDAVIEARRDLVEIVHTLRQVVCVKG